MTKLTRPRSTPGEREATLLVDHRSAGASSLAELDLDVGLADPPDDVGPGRRAVLDAHHDAEAVARERHGVGAVVVGASHGLESGARDDLCDLGLERGHRHGELDAVDEVGGRRVHDLVKVPELVEDVGVDVVEGTGSEGGLWVRGWHS